MSDRRAVAATGCMDAAVGLNARGINLFPGMEQ